MLRSLILVLLLVISATVLAEEQGATQSAPSSQQGENEVSSDQGPPVTITKETGQTIEEYRAGGRLYMIKVIPKHGKPYYLVDDRGDGRFARQDSLDSGVRPPRWIIHRF